MQNQADSARSAKPQEPRLARRVAASFNPGLEVLRRGNGKATGGPAGAASMVSGGIAGGLMMVTRQPDDRGFGASYWHAGTSVAGDSRRLDCAGSLLGGLIRVPGSDRVRSPGRVGVLRQFSRHPCTSAPPSLGLETGFRPAFMTGRASVLASPDCWECLGSRGCSPSRNKGSLK